VPPAPIFFTNIYEMSRGRVRGDLTRARESSSTSFTPFAKRFARGTRRGTIRWLFGHPILAYQVHELLLHELERRYRLAELLALSGVRERHS
jgi:hypothetical protein